MSFSLTNQSATLLSLTSRIERHGEEKVSAASMGFKITTANTILDHLDGSLRKAIYSPVEGQDDLPDIEPSTPLLRTKLIDTLSLKSAFEGWTIEIQYGIDEGDPITIGSAKVDKFKVKPSEGGSVDLNFRVGSNDISPAEFGALFDKLGHEVVITIIPPVRTEDTIDGSVEAFEADHPGLAGGGNDDDATDLFLEEHGSEG